MTTNDLDQLVRVANNAGHQSIAGHYQQLVIAMRTIANNESGPWGRLAYDALMGRGAFRPDRQEARR